MPSARRAILRALHVIAVVVLVSCGGRVLERAAPPGPTATPPVRVGSILMHLEPTTMVRPTRPPEAIERGITGPVVLEVRISGMSRSLLKSVRSGGMVRLSYDRVESQRLTL